MISHEHGWWYMQSEYSPFSFQGACTQTCFKPPIETVFQTRSVSIALDLKLGQVTKVQVWMWWVCVD